MPPCGRMWMPGTFAECPNPCQEGVPYMSLQVPCLGVEAKRRHSRLLAAAGPSFTTAYRLLLVSLGLRLSVRPSQTPVSGISRSCARMANAAVIPLDISDRKFTLATTGLTLLPLTTAFTTAYGVVGTPGKGGAPLSIVSPEVLAPEFYSVDTSVHQDPLDGLPARPPPTRASASFPDDRPCIPRLQNTPY